MLYKLRENAVAYRGGHDFFFKNVKLGCKGPGPPSRLHGKWGDIALSKLGINGRTTDGLQENDYFASTVGVKGMKQSCYRGNLFPVGKK